MRKRHVGQTDIRPAIAYRALDLLDRQVKDLELAFEHPTIDQLGQDGSGEDLERGDPQRFGGSSGLPYGRPKRPRK